MKLFKSNIATNMILNFTKYATTIFFPLLTYPYVSKILNVSDIGKINFSSSIISYFSLFAALGISNYAIRSGAKKKNDPKKLDIFISEVYSINIISCVLAYIALFVIYVFFIKNLNRYFVLLVIQSLVIFFNTVGKDWVNYIDENYIYITIRTIIIQFILLICIFIFVKNANDYLIYAILLVLGTSGNGILNYFYMHKMHKIKFVVDKRLSQHIKPIIILFFNNLAISIYVNSDITMLGIFTDDYSVGIYSFVSKVYSMIKSLLCAVLTTLLPRISALIAMGEMKKVNRLLNVIINGIIALLIPFIVFLIIKTKSIIMFIGSRQYIDGSLMFQILAGALLFAILSNFITNTFLLPFNKDNVLLKVTTLSAIINILLNIFCIPVWGGNGAAFTTLIAELLVFIICSYELSKSEFLILKIKMESIIYSVMATFLILLSDFFVRKMNIDSRFGLMIMGIFFGIVCMFYVLIIYKKNIKE